MVKIDSKKCLKCQACVSVCPNEALSFDGDKIVVDMKKCTNCGTCIDTCPAGAIEK